MPTKLFVYKTTLTDLETFETWRGARVDGLIAFVGTLRTALSAPADFLWAVGQLKAIAAVRPDLAFCLAVALLPNDVTGQLYQAARGAQTALWKAEAQDLVAAGLGAAEIRPGWEPNGNWYPWAAAKDPPDYRLAFMDLVDAYRSVPGQAFTFCFCVGAGTGAINPDLIMPDATHFDTLGQDLYDATNADLTKDWPWDDAMPNGVAWAVTRAKQLGKKLAFPEYGTTIDDPEFYLGLGAIIKDPANDVAYHGLWDSTAAANCCLSDGHLPHAAAAWLAEFGAPAHVAATPPATAPAAIAPAAPTKAAAAAAWALWLERLGYQPACTQAQADAALATVRAYFAAP